MTASLERTAVRLLLVEDDEVDRLACRRALSRQADFPIELLEASSGREGLELVHQRHPDLVLLDYHLPDVNGLEFLEALRRDSGEMPVPVMMLTGADSVGVAVEAMRSGARDYLVKDRQRSYLELLPAVIARVMGEQRLRGEKRAAEEKFRTLVEQIPAITYIAVPDAGGRLRYVSPQVQRLGYSAEQWLAEPQGHLAHVHPQDRADAVAAHARACDSGAPLRCEYRLLTPGGQVHWLLDEARLVRNADGTPMFLQGVLIDITDDKAIEAELRQHRERLESMVAERTGQLEQQALLLQATNAELRREVDERREAEAALRASRARFRLLLESAGEGIYGLDTEGRCTFVNDAALEMLGYTHDELIGRPTHSTIHHSRGDGTPYPDAQCPIYDAFRNGVARQGMVETLWRKDGSTLLAEYSSHPLREGDEITGAVLVFRDVTEAQAMAQRLAWQAAHDALTGLANRQEFERRLAHLIDSAQRDGATHALCFLDLDHFKIVNDTCGHAAGDELLRQVSALVVGRLRHRDTLARLGGDEFGLLLEHCPVEQALHIAIDLCDRVRDFRFDWQGHHFALGVSIGLAGVGPGVESAEAAMRAADSACYLAKERGRNRVEIYRETRPGEDAPPSRLLTPAWLVQALDEGRFRLYCQTIQPLGTGRPGSERAHHEILLRMLDPLGNLLEPRAFLPIADRYNLMPAIDRWVLREVVARCAVGARAPHPLPLVAVNLSARSLADDALVDELRGCLTRHAVPGEMLCIDLSESAALAHLDRTTERVRALKALGCRIALDHFGGGMSAFEQLRALPIDYLKIDGHCIRALAGDPVNRAVAEGINRIAHVMAIETVAECAETDEILAIAREIGIDHAQGYALSRPQPIEVLEQALQCAGGGQSTA